MSKTRKTFHRKWRGQRITQLMARDGSNCTICREPLDRHIRDGRHPAYITFDHVTPRSDGGNDAWTNLRLAHRRCNEKRGNDPILPEDEIVE